MTRSQEVDWAALRTSAPFQELVVRRGRFVRAASTLLLGWFAVFLVVIGAAPDVAGTVVATGLSVGFLLGLSQFVLAWLLTWLYLHTASTRFAPLEDQVRALAEAAVTEGSEVAR
jgi:uncharacterized membrane protein (DUF485 family)